MSYKLNKTDGSLLVDLIDGFIDNETTDLVLIGRNYSGYGEFFNENFIKLLENFANSSAPQNPITGQIWYDTGTQRLKIFNGETFNVAGGPIVQPTEPSMVAGDQWINNRTKQIFFNDGTQTYLIGPSYTAQQGTSGFVVDSILDTQSRIRTIVKLFIGGSLVAVLSNIEFTPSIGQDITGIPSPIKKGFNLVDPVGFKFAGTVDYATALIADNGEFKNVSQFLPADGDGTTVGSLTIANSNGLTIGLAQNNIQRVVGTSFVVENGLLNHDYKIRVTSSAEDSRLIDAITVKAATKRVGIFKENPEYSLDVTGDMRITGNLLVEGDTTSVDVATIKVEDKNIELAAPSNGTLQTELAIDDAGIIVKAITSDKKFTWKQANASWFSTENLDLASGKSYRINGTTVVNETSLGFAVEEALGLARIGQLEFLDVDNINIDGNTITSNNSGLFLTSSGAITVNSQKITGVAAPALPSDVTNKQYVDTIVASEPVVFSLDITGLVDDDIALIINDLFPATAKEVGTYARIHTTTLTNAVVTGIQITVRDTTEPDNGEVLTLSKINVDSNGTQNEPVVRDVEFSNPASGAVTTTLVRGLKQFVVDNTGSGNFWRFDQNLTSSV